MMKKLLKPFMSKAGQETLKLLETKLDEFHFYESLYDKNYPYTFDYNNVSIWCANGLFFVDLRHKEENQHLFNIFDKIVIWSIIGSLHKKHVKLVEQRNLNNKINKIFGDE